MGEDFIKFVQSCQIGLGTQNPDAEFNNTSFPSKILTYMANGLQVVSVRIPAVESPADGKYLHYYDAQQLEEIAQAVLRVESISNNYTARAHISNLHQRLMDSMNLLFSEK